MEKEREIVYNYCYEDNFTEEDICNRRLYLNSEVDGTAVDNIAYHIMRYNRLDKGIPKEERKPIVLYINSPGGSVSDGYGVIDAMLTSETPVYTVNMAMCASMAFLIFIAGAKRYSFKHSEFLMHDGSTMGFDSTAKMKDRMEFETIQLEKMTKNYILSRTKISEEIYNKKYRCEWYFLADEGKEIGTVDFIIGEDCSIDDIL
jgi:ATP-dependent Clp protease, protease subunit